MDLEKIKKEYFEKGIPMRTIIAQHSELTNDSKNYLLEWCGDNYFLEVKPGGNIVCKDDIIDLYKKIDGVARLEPMHPAATSQEYDRVINDAVSLCQALERLLGDKLVSESTEKKTQLPDGFHWECYEDGSGCVIGPNREHYFSYDMAPYSNVGWIEYQSCKKAGWKTFDGTLTEYKKYVEEQFGDFIKKWRIFFKDEGDYFVGTVNDIAEEIADLYLCSENKNWKEAFPDVDFTFCPDNDKNLSLADLRYKCEGWYGLKKVKTGFDSNDLDLVADYYGGSCGCFGSIYSGMEKEEIIKVVKGMLLYTLNETEVCDENTILFAEKLNK